MQTARLRIFIVFVTGAVILGSSCAAAGYEPKTEVERLAHSWVRAGALGIGAEASYDRREKEIHDASPAIKKALLDIANYYYVTSPDWEATGMALRLLAIRDDLTPAEVRPVADELIKIAQGKGTPSAAHFGYVNGGLDLLAIRPTPDAEDIVILFLGDKFQTYHYDAAITLWNMGTEKSLPLLRECIARDSGKVAPWEIEEMNKALSGLEKRLKEKSKAGKPGASQK